MTLTDALEDVDFITLIEDDLAVECDIWPECSTVASWSIRCQRCGEVSFACNLHRAHLDQAMARVVYFGAGLIVCAKCEWAYPSPMPWLPL